MKNIGIVTKYHYVRGKGDFYYPLLKWKKKFSQRGIKFYFFRTHKNKKLFNNDIVIIDTRYIRDMIAQKKIYPDKSFIIDLILKLKSKGIKVILFDQQDGAGSTKFDLIEYVDVFVKKQVLKNREEYLKNKGGYSVRPFSEKYNISEEAHLNLLSLKETYTPCPPDQLHKIKVGWNIGMCDYRYFPLDRYYPPSLKNVLNFIYKEPNIERDYTNKTIDTAFRGNVKKEVYSFQRNKVIELLNKKSKYNFVTGSRISKREYINELNQSKTCISPYGYGEICYRDFEAIISGCVMIKPDMSHLDTYPDIYKENETYVPVKIDMSDLESTLNDVLENYKSYIPMVKKSQNEFLTAINDAEGFINHFKSFIEYEG